MRPRHVVLAAILGAALAAVAVAAHAGGEDGTGDDRDDRELPQGSQRVRLDPPTSRWTSTTRGGRCETEVEGTQQRVTVTDQTRLIANGVRARVIRDEVTEDGVAVEITDDWYAQDDDGNVRFLGEAVRN
jgi:hypothetical protein